MEKNQKKEPKLTDNYAQIGALFDHLELTMEVLSNLSIGELLNVKTVCKKWLTAVRDLEIFPTTFKKVFGNSFGDFIGPEYLDIIANSPIEDIRRAFVDPTFARTLFNMDKYFVANDNVTWNPDVLGIPQRITHDALLDLLFSDKPIWRSTKLTNSKSNTNDQYFVLPTFQPHNLPQVDSLLMQIFFFSLVMDGSNYLPVSEVFKALETRATTMKDRSKAISIMCQWIANHYWDEHSQVLDPLLDRFLGSASNEEKSQIERAKILKAQSRAYDWERYDRALLSKLNNEQLVALKVHIKIDQLEVPIKVMNIPVHELAKQVALSEHKSLRSFDLGTFIKQRWRDNADFAPFKRFNKIFKGLAHWILTQPTVKKRYEASAYLLQLGHELIQIRCASAVVMIYRAFDMLPIRRLLSVKKAIANYPNESAEIMDIGQNGQNQLRLLTKNQNNEPTVPYVGLTIKDLVFISEANAWLNNGAINFNKPTIYLKHICEYLKNQFIPYLYEPVEPLQQLWEAFADNEYTEEELYAMSEAIKPRGEDAKETDRPKKK